MSLLLASSATTSTPVTASPSTAVTATTSTTTFTRAGFIDHDLAAHEVLAVEGLDNAGCFFIVVDFNEAEPTRLSSFAVRHQAHGRYCRTRLLEPIGYFLLCSLEW